MRTVTLYTSKDCGFCRIMHHRLENVKQIFTTLQIDVIDVEQENVDNITKLPTIAIGGEKFQGVLEEEEIQEILLSV